MIFNKISILLFISFFYVSQLNAQSLKEVWKTDQVFEVPESVLYDSNDDLIYVSNIKGNSSEMDGEGYISTMKLDGEIIKLKWLEGLNAPKGMAIFDGKLYVADVDALVEVDINNAKILNRYTVENAVFCNDVAACKNGWVFMSDTRTGKVHVLKNGKMEVFLNGPIERVNGLFTQNGKLYVGSYDIHVVDIKTKEIKLIYKGAGPVDGIEKMKNGELVFSHWSGKVFVSKETELIKLIDSSEEKINTADIDFVEDQKLVLIPTFMDNRVVAYKLIN